MSSIHNDTVLSYPVTEFMSPEISLAMDFDQSADIFSLGIMMCELITLQEPSATFLHRQPKTMFALDEEELRKEILPSCPEKLEALTLSCCNVEPAKRPNILICRNELEVALGL